MDARLADKLAYLLGRPERKARQRRVLDALDAVCPRWEQLAREPAFLAWLSERHPRTGGSWGQALVDMSDEFEEVELALLFHVGEGMITGKRPRRGLPLAGGRYTTGQIIARHYEVVDLLGAGGFGEVLLVYSHEPGMREFHAMKVLRPGTRVNAATLARFAKEAYLLMGLRPHPCVVSTPMVELLPDGTLVLLSEFVPPDARGRVTLGDLILAGELTPERQSRILIECCAGLQATYLDGIRAHRDLKPANILLGVHERARVADFGLAALDGGEEPTSEGLRATPLGLLQTQEGQSFGTPPYMAPEQFLDAAACDERSDVYSLGIVLFQMASGGKLPFLAGTDARWNEWALLHARAPVRVLAHPLNDVLHKCLEKRPVDRYPTVMALAAALAEVRDERGWKPVKIHEPNEFEMSAFRSRMRRAIGFMRLGHQARAIPMFQECADRFDLGADAYIVLCHKELGEYEQAIACGMKYRSKARSADTEVILGYCHAKLGLWDAAVPHYQTAVERDPRHANAWENLGRGLMVLRRHQEARMALQCCTALPDAGMEAWILCAESEALLQSYPAALSALARAHELAGDADADQVARLAKLEDWVQLRSQFEQVRRILGPGFTEKVVDEICAAAWDAVKQPGGAGVLQVQALRRRWPAVMVTKAEAILALYSQARGDAPVGLNRQ